MLKGFRDFLFRGNIVELAIAIVIAMLSIDMASARAGTYDVVACDAAGRSMVEVAAAIGVGTTALGRARLHGRDPQRRVARTWRRGPGELVLGQVAVEANARYFQPGNGQMAFPVASSFGQTVKNFPFYNQALLLLDTTWLEK